MSRPPRKHGVLSEVKVTAGRRSQPATHTWPNASGVRRSFAVAAAVLVFVPPAALGDQRPDEWIQNLTGSVPGLLDRYQIPTAAVVITSKEGTVGGSAFGTPLTERRNVFKVASLTKTAVALAILRLVERGEIDLDEPVNTYLKRWRVRSDRFDENGVTARTLLAHTSGMPFGFSRDPPKRYPDIVDVLEGHTSMPAATLEREPGRGFEYSNIGYGVLELLIEDVTGVGFTRAMSRSVLKPLGMNDSGFQDDTDLVERLVPGHARAGKDATPYSISFPRAAGGMLSTSEDIGKLLTAAMYPNEDGGLLDDSSLHEMRRLEGASRGALIPDGGYALGIATGEMPSSGFFVGNNGSHEDYNCLMVGVPSKNQGLVVLTNSGTGIGLEIELATKWFRDVVGESPELATRFESSRRWLRRGTIVALALCLLWLVWVTRRVRRGRRAWTGKVRLRSVLLKTLPIVVIAIAIYLSMNTYVLTGIVGLGLQPSRLISADYRFLISALCAALILIGVSAATASKVRDHVPLGDGRS